MLQSTAPEKLDNKKSLWRDIGISKGRENRRDLLGEKGAGTIGGMRGWELERSGWAGRALEAVWGQDGGEKLYILKKDFNTL